MIRRNYIGCTNKFPSFFIKNWAFIVKERNLMFFSKYFPSLATTFSHLSVRIRIPRQKNASSFEANHEWTQFLGFSYNINCCSDRPCVIDRNKWKSEGAMSGEFQIGFDRRRNTWTSNIMQENNFVVSGVVVGALFI